MPPTSSSGGSTRVTRILMSSDGAGHEFPGFHVEGGLAQGVPGVFAGGFQMAVAQGPPGPAAMGVGTVFLGAGKPAEFKGYRFAALQAVGADPPALSGEFTDKP